MEHLDAIINNPENAHALLKAVYQNSEVPLAVRVRVAIACLPYEMPKLAVVAQVSENDFATLLDQRIERMKAIETKPTNNDKMIEGNPVDARLPPSIPDRRYRRF